MTRNKSILLCASRLLHLMLFWFCAKEFSYSELLEPLKEYQTVQSIRGGGQSPVLYTSHTYRFFKKQVLKLFTMSAALLTEVQAASSPSRFHRPSLLCFSPVNRQCNNFVNCFCL